MGFFETCLEELGEHISEEIRYNAISARASQMETADFDKFMVADKPLSEKRVVVVDHEANIRKSQGK